MQCTFITICKTSRFEIELFEHCGAYLLLMKVLHIHSLLQRWRGLWQQLYNNRMKSSQECVSVPFATCRPRREYAIKIQSWVDEMNSSSSITGFWAGRPEQECLPPHIMWWIVSKLFFIDTAKYYYNRVYQTTLRQSSKIVSVKSFSRRGWPFWFHFLLDHFNNGVNLGYTEVALYSGDIWAL